MTDVFNQMSSSDILGLALEKTSQVSQLHSDQREQQPWPLVVKGGL